MKKKNIIVVILVNIIIFIFFWYLSDCLIYRSYAKDFYKTNSKEYPLNKMKYLTQPFFGFDINSYFDGSDDMFMGRTPDGLEYEGKPAITIFGCSYAHGQNLKKNQTFSYKLAQALKRPVYNRAIPGRGLQHMYYQTKSNIFYKDVPPSDTVIYVMMYDHYRRMKVFHINILDTYFVGNYKKQGDTLVPLDYSSPLKNIIRSSHTVNWIQQKYLKSYISNPKNADELTDEVLLYFTESRKNLEKRWGKKVDFIVLFYNWIFWEDELKQKLEANGFRVYSLDKDIVNDDLTKDIYKISQENGHPNEYAWDIITPLLIKKLDLK